MPNTNYFVLGDHNGVCDLCGRTYKFSELKKAWDGSWRCPKDWNIRQPQDFLRAVKDNPAVPVSRARIVSIGQSNLAAPLTTTAISLTVTAGEGTNFPTTYPFFITMQSVTEGKVEELVKVTLITGDVFTIVRNVGNYPAQAWATGDLVILTSLNPVVSL
jgi:hypothetical protein